MIKLLESVRVYTNMHRKNIFLFYIWSERLPHSFRNIDVKHKFSVIIFQNEVSYNSSAINILKTCIMKSNIHHFSI